ncbi:MAG: aminotransferase class III-fold pyridoxal phosphate-dependent enzyme [Proteobacteria bacterium]|nr:aminotransferase class III-fold pyridoxal phosphate-dependent enzyme [Pseudomonadota bacterium]
MPENTTPCFESAAAAALAADLFGIRGEASPLPSERDQNFLLTGAGGERFVLKFAKADEERGVLEFQNAALRHLQRRADTLEFPHVIPARDGQEIASAHDGTGRSFLTRVVTWLDGDVSARAPQTDALLASLGTALAQIDTALADFSHPGMRRVLQWDLRHVGEAMAHLHLLPQELRAIVTRFRTHWEALDWSHLRHGVIHGDANDYNVLTRHGRVTGLIDFGDMVHTALVCEPAIGAAYTMLDKPDPLHAAATVTASYHERYPLTGAELDALLPLIAARLCMSACYSAHNAIAKRGDGYQLISAAPVTRLLRQLEALPWEECRERLRAAATPAASVLAARRRLLGGSLKLSYRQPRHMVRGEMQYLFDAEGRRYLDAYNNVPHVGHCHPRVVAAAAAHMATLNTNTRYLSELPQRYAERLTATLPAPLRVCYFVNSGSEANELALRLARAHTGARELVVLQHAYHGNTSTLIDISPYKHDGPGGAGAPPWVHVAPLPDLYRGAFRRGDAAAGAGYAAGVAAIIAQLRERRRALCGYIAESWPSVGGQLDFPPGYLAEVYRLVRAAGGVCIADEVQTGYGRLGGYFWGFEAYGVVPDIVVLGKPIGNGHPLGAVVTTPQIAASFDNGMEYFSTFGGNTVSCAIGSAVLEVVQGERLQAHALDVGQRLLAGLHLLKDRHTVIGDVRGSGLFLGIELVRDRGTRDPATAATARVIDAMADAGVLLGSEGPAHNVIKLRPPLPFTAADADMLLEQLDRILSRLDAP